MKEDSEPRVYSVEETGRILRISRGSAYERVRTGEIPSIRLGRRILIPAASLRDLIGEKTKDSNKE